MIQLLVVGIVSSTRTTHTLSKKPSCAGDEDALALEVAYDARGVHGIQHLRSDPFLC